MSENEQSNPPKQGRWLKRLLWIVAGLVVVVIVVYFVATSSAFFKSVVLPKVGAALNADVTVGNAAISPFSSVALQDLKVTPKGGEPLCTAKSISAKYSLMAIIRGNILVDEVAVVDPTITVIQNADGTSNLDPLLKTEKLKAEAKPAPVTAPSAAKPSPPPAVDVKSILLKNATIHYVKNIKGGGRETTDLTQVNVTISNIKNGAAGKLDFSAALAMVASNMAVQVNAKGSFALNLTQDLKPGAVKGEASVNIAKATGDLAELTALTAKLDCDTTPTEIKRLALSFTRADAALGEVRVSGPFDVAKTEGKLKVEVLSIDRQVLNLAGAASGIDFGTTTINSSNEIELTKGGDVIAAAGTLTIGKFQVTRQSQTTPTLNLRCEYSVAVNQANKTVSVKVLNIAATQNQQPLLQAELTSPMSIGWGGATTSMGDAALTVALTGLNLADWKAFASEYAPAGVANMKLKLLSQAAGNQLTFDLDGQVEKFSVKVDQNQLPPLNIQLVTKGTGKDMKQFNLSESRLELTQGGQPVFSAVATGTFDAGTTNADLQVTAQAVLNRLIALYPVTNVTCSAGNLNLTSHITNQQQSRTVTGQIALTGFTGSYSDYRLADFGTSVDLDVLMKGNSVEIHKVAGQLHEGKSDGGKFDITGNYDLDKKAGQLTAKLADFKEGDLRPFLQPSLGDKKLVSITINTSLSAGFDANGDGSVKGDVQLANFVVQDLKNPLPDTPLEVRLQVDASNVKKIATIRQCQLVLTPTKRAKNELQLTGTVDYSQTNAITGNLKLAADALDATAYYDIFSKTEKPSTATTPAPATPPPAPASAAKTEETEPAPVLLPVRNFICEAAIGHFYLRDVDIAKLQTTMKLDGGRVTVNPCQFTLNDAPVNANVALDLSVAGYKYDVTFTADKVPLEPLAKSFSPTYADKAQGILIANIQVKGAGVTGRSLQKSLAGQVNLSFTNADIQIVGPKVKKILTPIAIVLGAPQMLNSPLDYVNVVLQLGDGKIETREFVAHSAAFCAISKGTIPIADVLNNSPLSQPVDIELSRDLASRLHISVVSAEGDYAKLPTFVHLAGTLGDPTAKTDKAVIVGLTASGIAGTVGGKAGGLLQGIGGLLGGQPATATNAPPANSPQNAPFSPFDLFKKRK